MTEPWHQAPDGRPLVINPDGGCHAACLSTAVVASRPLVAFEPEDWLASHDQNVALGVRERLPDWGRVLTARAVGTRNGDREGGGT